MVKNVLGNDAIEARVLEFEVASVRHEKLHARFRPVPRPCQRDLRNIDVDPDDVVTLRCERSGNFSSTAPELEHLPDLNRSQRSDLPLNHRGVRHALGGRFARTFSKRLIFIRPPGWTRRR